MEQYQDMLRYVQQNGVQKGDRTGTGTLSCFGYQNRYDLSKGFPLMTTKRVPFRLVLSELLWFIRGNTNIYELVEQKNYIWVPDAFREYLDTTGATIEGLSEEEVQAEINKFIDLILNDEHFANLYGELGPIYGKQWRRWVGEDDKVYDQLADVIQQIKDNPDSRRLIVSAWNVSDIPRMALPPCHAFFQLYVSEGKLSCQLYQRSADIFLGVAFNIASYALVVHMIAFLCGLEVGEFIHTFGDLHIYNNHIEQVELQLTREPRSLPKLVIKDRGQKTIDDFVFEDFELIGYDPHPTIKGKVSVGL